MTCGEESLQVRPAGCRTQEMCLERLRAVSSSQNTERWKGRLWRALKTVVRSNIPQASRLVVQRTSSSGESYTSCLDRPKMSTIWKPERLWYAAILFSSLGLGHRWWHSYQSDGFSSRDWYVGHPSKLQEALWKVPVLLHQGGSWEACLGPGESSDERTGSSPSYLDTSYLFLLCRCHSLERCSPNSEISSLSPFTQMFKSLPG